MIENDLQKILKVNPDDIFFFIGLWELFDFSKSEKIKHIGRYRSVASNDTVNGKDGRNLGSTSGRGHGCIPELNFDIGILYAMSAKGLSAEYMEACLPQMFETFNQQLERGIAEQIIKWKISNPEKWANDVRNNRLREWELKVKGWRDDYTLIRGLSPEDLDLYEKVEELIWDFDWMIPEESAIEGEGHMTNITWNTIKIVQNGGGANEVIAHLKKFGQMWPDEKIAHNLQRIRQIKEDLESRKGRVDPERTIACIEDDIKRTMEKKDSFIRDCAETAGRIVKTIETRG
jgi:hypothetical protein